MLFISEFFLWVNQSTMVREVFKHQLRISTFASYSELQLGWSAKIVVVGKSFEWLCHFAKLYFTEHGKIQVERDNRNHPVPLKQRQPWDYIRLLRPSSSWVLKPSEMESAQPCWRPRLCASSVITTSWYLSATPGLTEVFSSRRTSPVPSASPAHSKGSSPVGSLLTSTEHDSW